MQMVKKAQSQNTTTTYVESLEDYDLGGVDCEMCGNKGTLIERGPGLLELHVTECPCMKKRRSLRSIRKAGMEDMARRYTFDSYKADNSYRAKIKNTAQFFADQDKGWLFIGGKTGSGKTHICTAVCSALMERFSEIRFMQWRDDSTALKQGVKEREWYEAETRKYKQVPVLYIDDFFKGGVTDADVKLAYEILNARYNNEPLRTIISSEMSLEEIGKIDEAISGRIYERARGFILKAPDENYRLRG